MLFVILQDDNIERIKQYDPAEVVIAKMGPGWGQLRLRDVVIMYASEDEVAEVLQVIKDGTSPTEVLLITAILRAAGATGPYAIKEAQQMIRDARAAAPEPPDMGPR